MMSMAVSSSQQGLLSHLCSGVRVRVPIVRFCCIFVAASIIECTHCGNSGNFQFPAVFVEPESCDMHHPRLLHCG